MEFKFDDARLSSQYKNKIGPINFFLFEPILFLYYEESLVSSSLNSKLFRFHWVRPSEHCPSSFSKIMILNNYMRFPLEICRHCNIHKMFISFISELYDFCIKEKIADGNIIAKWKKQGYENLCCLRCIQSRDTNFATNCICRVPKTKLEEGKIVECVHCGCRGCSG